MRTNIFFLLGIVTWLGCKHSFPNTFGDPTPYRVEVQVPCQGCNTSPICAVVDDIPKRSNTTYTICDPTPQGQGSASLDGNHCLIWSASQEATEVVHTCLVACTSGVCDSTYITILPALPGEGIPCSADTVYFTNDILPILTSNCAFSGCHNQQSHAEGVVLDNYNQIINTGEVRAGKPNNSELYEVITSTKASKVMPPPPAPKLSAEQIAKIQKWILQGAKNNQCNTGGCDTLNVSFSAFVKPALAGCLACHNATTANGGIRLDTYSGIKAVAVNGRLYGSISWSQGYIPMPTGGIKLDDCRIKKIKSWIDVGSPEN